MTVRRWLAGFLNRLLKGTPRTHDHQRSALDRAFIKRAEELATQIDSFLKGRFTDYLVQMDGLEGVAALAASERSFDAHDRETCRLYRVRFKHTVNELTDQIGAYLDVRSPELGQAYHEVPSSNDDICMVVNGLRGLGNQLDTHRGST